MTITTKIFTNGNSQAVRIPAKFRLNASEVHIYKNSAGDLVIHPLPEKTATRGTSIFNCLANMDTDWLDAVAQEKQNALSMQEREGL